MRPLALAAAGTLLLLCTACTSHLATRNPFRPRPRADATTPSKPEDVSRGGFGADDAGGSRGVSRQSGSASDNHGDLQSKRPDGGKSDTTAVTATAPGPPVPEGAAPAPGAVPDKSSKDQAAASTADADKAVSGKSGDATSDDADGKGAATNSTLKPSSGNRPVNASDPAIIGPPVAGRRKRT